VTAVAPDVAGRRRTRATERTVRVRVARSAAGARDEFTVRVVDPTTVLDLLRQIQTRHDPSLAFRYSCRVAMCGTCGVRVDGRSTLACRSVLGPEVDEVEVAPLAGLPVVRDLIVDTRPFWAEWARVKPWFVPKAGDAPRVAPGSPEAELVEGALGCISCGACYSTCEVTRHRGDYLGPAALNRALALIADPRDGAAAERLAIVGGRGGVDRCHYVGGCSAACPVGLDPARSIVELRRLRLARA
jgi:succinate dehydrogenase / fumarate reductase iron-sulfur subunit/fumarate reductase iron-sulfur subunit